MSDSVSYLLQAIVVKCEFINVTRWKLAICGEYMKSRLKTCSCETASNFIHCFRNPGGDHEWAGWEKPPPKYWLKKMAALFGYSHESGYQKQMEQDYSGQMRNSNNINTTDADRHWSRRSKSREMDCAKSSSRKSYDADHDVWESTRSQRCTNDNRMRIKHLDKKFHEQSTKFKDFHYSESRSDETNSDGNETNSDGSWAVMDRDRDRDRHHSNTRKSVKRSTSIAKKSTYYGATKNRTAESDSDWSCSDGKRDTKIRHIHTKRSSVDMHREVLDDNGDSENKTREVHGDAMKGIETEKETIARGKGQDTGAK